MHLAHAGAVIPNGNLMRSGLRSVLRRCIQLADDVFSQFVRYDNATICARACFWLNTQHAE